jgi:hypothetical protein
MHNELTRRRPARVAPWLALGGLLAAGLLSACSTSVENTFTVLADPGKYEFYSCDQIAAQQKFWRNKEQDLKLLMDKARQSTGGAVINVIAYQSDYVGAQEELKVLAATARSKKCKPPSEADQPSGEGKVN